jgi:biotin operon repressor
MDKRMTQNQQILQHMKRTGSITLREALIDYSVQSLTKRIQELRGLGYKINSVAKTHPTTGQRYTRYTLIRKTPVSA